MNLVGPINTVSAIDIYIRDKNLLTIGPKVKNCDITNECGAEEFPVHIYSGYSTDRLGICVDGQ